MATDFEANYLACADGDECVSNANANGKAINLYVLDYGTVAHEYYHVMQGKLSNNNEPTGGGSPWVKPHWLVEGAATFAAYAAEQGLTEIGDEPVVPRSDLNAPAWREYRLCDLTGDVYGSELNLASYLLGSLAVEYLVRMHSDLNRVLDFWRVADYASDFSDAFRIAYDLELDVFCESFEEYRARELRHASQ